MFSYESIPVYQKAFNVNRDLYRILKENLSIPNFLKLQLGRACLSIMLNIAEGSGKFGKRDRRNFYIIARSSSFECAALINFLFLEGEIPDQQREKLYPAMEEISKILFVMIKNLES